MSRLSFCMSYICSGCSLTSIDHLDAINVHILLTSTNTALVILSTAAFRPGTSFISRLSQGVPVPEAAGSGV